MTSRTFWGIITFVLEWLKIKILHILIPDSFDVFDFDSSNNYYRYVTYMYVCFLFHCLYSIVCSSSLIILLTIITKIFFQLSLTNVDLKLVQSNVLHSRAIQLRNQWLHQCIVLIYVETKWKTSTEMWKSIRVLFIECPCIFCARIHLLQLSILLVD